MKYLVAYHTKTGNNARLAEAISNELKERGVDVDIMRIKPRVDIPIPLAGFQGQLRMTVKLKEDYDISGYDRYIFCGPVWAGGVSPVLKGLIGASDCLRGKRAYIALCCLSPAIGAMKTLAELLETQGAAVISRSRLQAQEAKNQTIFDKYVEEVVANCLN
jgi:flavodoxin